MAVAASGGAAASTNRKRRGEPLDETPQGENLKRQRARRSEIEFGRQMLYAADFAKADPDLPRLLVIGATGSGKSTLLNAMGGWQLVQNSASYEYEWRLQGGRKPPFHCDFSTQSITELASFCNLYWRGKKRRPFLAVDSPGCNDTKAAQLHTAEARDRLRQFAADLHNKLKALESVDLILILHNDVVSNRLDPVIQEMFRLVLEKFRDAGVDVWKHVAVAYSKCNPHENHWKGHLERKKQQVQQQLRDDFGCNTDVPVFALGGAISDLDVAQQDGPIDASDSEFEKLWNVLSAAGPLSTKDLKPFEGMDVKYEQILRAKEEAMQAQQEALAKLQAYKDLNAAFTQVLPTAFLLFLLVFPAFALLYRGWVMTPTFGRILTFNVPGAIDELMILGFCGWRLGLQHSELWKVFELLVRWVRLTWQA
eukprot:TRINITY_DN13259_c0_g2_i1.p1 TRINITY_DN13259_c0_g2~~TRINITY_DN13259_c0_g2_i1.p1  ORF type:complete len:424 (+),score=60.05 TRINITY_DN13259_c0_g2_i1:79-1350(+)